MNANFFESKVDSPPVEKNVSATEIKNYSDILKQYNVEYRLDNYHLQVKEIINSQGWILHLSVIISQIVDLLIKIVPILVIENVPFKLIMDKDTAIDLLSGNLGTTQIGKIVTIYPESDQEAVRLAKQLILYTSSFKGPEILTDRLLGNIVYTRYGSFMPLQPAGINGRKVKYITTTELEKIEDHETIPFECPSFISWPFSEITVPEKPVPPKILQNIYKITDILKSDVRGNVYKALYLKKLLLVKKCVIKQGNENMSSEISGRDIHDRLKWQQELYFSLADTIPLPEILDLFTVDGTMYLVMKYIKGRSFYEKIKEINPNSKEWNLLNFKDALRIVDYTIAITSIIKKLHARGFVHRDIVPVNFMINKKNRIYLLDIELTYSINDHKPTPPFEYGTAGFMSPEQQRVEVPTFKEDVYGLGALILDVLSGLSPVKFDQNHPASLIKKINFFIGDNDLASLIGSCLSYTPELRPKIDDIENTLKDYRNKLQRNAHNTPVSKLPFGAITKPSIEETISLALEGLTKPPIIIFNEIWCSRLIATENYGIAQYKEYSIFPGIRYGISGVIYLLARAKGAGFDIDSSKGVLRKSIAYCVENYLNTSENLQSGLYSGAAGIALALAQSMKFGILINNEDVKTDIFQLLQMATECKDLANGMAGQGTTILQCLGVIEQQDLLQPLNRIVESLVTTQEDDGSWLIGDESFLIQNRKPLSFGYGIVGIIWFLLRYISIFSDNNARSAVHKSIDWLLKRTRHLDEFLDQKKFERKILLGHEVGDERKGILLTFLKAYELFGDEYLKRIIEKALRAYPCRMVNNNFTQENGLAAMGELYLEAGRICKNVEWYDRANWIAGVFTNSLIKNKDGSGYWKMEEYNDPTADFMIGNSGIIHFLLRCLDPDKIGYRILE
ncbi:MAG: lanthionine synthetase LanC family protein [Puia sp.]|nr:lanthionine synthetase LanC family protein [Puia sp.]